VTAERAGALVGALVATLPVGAGPAYVFLALDHDAAFIAQSALGSLAINTVNVLFALAYALLAQRHRLLVIIPVVLGIWFALAYLVLSVEWTLLSAALSNIVVIPICIAIGRRLRDAPMPLVKRKWYDPFIRAIMVSILIGILLALSFRISPTGAGILAVFPIVLLSIMLILQPRVGGPATGAILANTMSGLIGFGLATVMLNMTAVPLGSATALALALAVIPRAPTAYDPLKHRERMLRRRDYVLDMLVERGAISAEAARFAKADLVKYGPGRVGFMNLVARHIDDPSVVDG